MKTICYYISDYGFGHASRSVAIIRELLAQSDEIKVIVCHSYALAFMKESLGHEGRVEFREVSTDIGYILKQNSLEPDVKGLNLAFHAYMENMDDVVRVEVEFCRRRGVAAILSDIVAFPFKAAKELGIPSIRLSNFTWYTAYKQLMDEDRLETLRGYYSLMDYHFSLAASNEPSWGIRENRGFGFVSRGCDQGAVEELRRWMDPKGSKTIVYFGLGMKVFMDELDGLALWDSPNCCFVVSSNVAVRRENVHRIPKFYTESQHFVAASDLVITKAGWSTVAEAVNANKPLVVLNRSHMEEDENMIEFLKKYKRAEVMDWQEIRNLRIDQELVGRLEEQKRAQAFVNEASGIVGGIIEVLF
ncbi:glycosyltransferase [Neobacillus muris]|uniref:glycosyltransferase n=1 Tax=Neobacillus muris TaxID=2941334 RepID=UPI00203ABDF8|nr:glycosyltransferase [Neobacillus muris]